MPRKRKKIFKKKGKIIKDLTKNIFKILNEDSNKYYNYRQIAAKMGISDTDGKTQILKKLAELTANKKIKEIERSFNNINVDDLSSGLYLLKIYSENQSFTTKILKE